MSLNSRWKRATEGLVGTVQRRIALSVVTLCAAFGFVLVGTTSAFAHDNAVSGVTACSNGQSTVTWTVTNDWPLAEVATVDSASYNPFGYSTPFPSTATFAPMVSLSDPLVVQEETANGDTVGSGTAGMDLGAIGSSTDSETIVETLPPGFNATATINVHGFWTDGYQTGTTDLPAGDSFNSDVEGAVDVTSGCKAAPSIISVPSSTSFALGGSNTDTVTVTGTNSVPPTGSITFYECGPSASSCSSTTGTEVGSAAVKLVTSGTAVATATSVSFMPAAAGSYCYVGVYSGDANYTGGADTNGSAECFSVTNVVVPTSPPISPPTITAVINAPSIISVPSSTSFALGGSNTDTVTVTGTNSVPPTGSITFYECGPSASSCSSTTGTEVGSAAVKLVTSGTAVATATSVSFMPAAAGSYCYVGVYSGDANYTGGADTNGSAECFSVTNVVVPTSPPTITATATTPTVSTPTANSPTPTIATSPKSMNTTTPEIKASAAVAIPNASSVQTGMPWAGSTRFLLLLAGLGILMIGSAEALRRRGHS